MDATSFVGEVQGCGDLSHEIDRFFYRESPLSENVGKALAFNQVKDQKQPPLIIPNIVNWDNGFP